ncbi:MAG: DUF2325 domain-containing protein [Proteobacteria bacterium]|nr:DUF2325 domain-containing protein [Pseudomonadota bacterium]
MSDQAAGIERINAQLMRQRAAAIGKDTQLAFLAQDMEPLRARQAEPERQNEGMRQQLVVARRRLTVGEAEDRLASARAGADRPICQTGCISHNAYWRVHDSCRRAGKPCVMVNEAIVPADGAGQASGN